MSCNAYLFNMGFKKNSAVVQYRSQCERDQSYVHKLLRVGSDHHRCWVLVHRFVRHNSRFNCDWCAFPACWLNALRCRFNTLLSSTGGCIIVVSLQKTKPAWQREGRGECHLRVLSGSGGSALALYSTPAVPPSMPLQGIKKGAIKPL